MKFIVQLFEGKIVHDFTFELIKSQEYFEWMNDPFEIIYVEKDIPLDLENPDEYIPVGSVNFVSDYLNIYYPDSKDALKPLNVPECLFDFAGRWINNVYGPEDMCIFDHQRLLHGTCKKLYRKSLTTIKDKTNGLYEYINSQNPFFGYQVSEEIDIESEWRVFVFHNEILYIANYSGDCTMFPDIDTIKKMVNIYKGEAPVAYTLDVGIRNGVTIIIECHRFFSCGLYGFNNLAKLPVMLSQTWYEMKNIDKLKGLN